MYVLISTVIYVSLTLDFFFQTAKQVKAAMTPDEKEKLYKAIGYQENDVPAELPESYVATQLAFVLKALEIVIKNDELSDVDNINRIVFLQLENVTCNVEQRPGGNALKYV